MARTKQNSKDFHGPHGFCAVVMQAFIDKDNEMGSDYD